jgi:tetratricopeptide (TPR) repeat protein
MPAAIASPTGTAPVATAPPTQSLVEFLADRVAADPDDGDAQLELGLALIQRLRETADPSLYAVAQAALEAAHRLLPDDPQPLVGLGGLQLGRHAFADALETGRAALELEPESVEARDVVVDALIELGRYDEAFTIIDRASAIATDLPTLARISYSRELRGDLEGALDAMRAAADARGLAPENTAFALGIVGHLETLHGRPQAARAAYEHALALVPDHVPSMAGLGRLAVGSGDLALARSSFERAVAILPSAEYAVALGDVLTVTGDGRGATREYAAAHAQIQLLRAAGVAVDQELALFEADHGDPVTALGLAETAYRATPTIRAADALAWALHGVGRDAEAWEREVEAHRLGTPDPLGAYHAGVIADTLGRADPATWLRRALDLDAGFSALGAADARQRLDRLGG